MKKFIFINLTILVMYIILNISLSIYLTEFLKTNSIGEYQNYSFDGVVNVVSVGTSHGSTSFNWELINELNGVNLARSGQPVTYDLQLLNHYDEFIDHETLIIVPLSLHTFCMEQSNFSDLDAIYDDGLYLLGFVRTSKIFYALENVFVGRKFPQDQYDGSFAPSEIPEWFWNCTNERKQEVIDKLVEISSSYSNVVFITTPRFIPTNQDIDYYNQFYDLVTVMLELTNRDYYDYSFDNRFDDVSYFYNSGHLNSSGREKFTKIIIDEVVSKH